MKLIDLDPRWYAIDGIEGRVGLTFDCPHCRVERLGVAFHHRGREAMEDAVIHAKIPEKLVWTMDGPEDFAVLTLSPSIDASKYGHWHGFITNGEIR